MNISAHNGIEPSDTSHYLKIGQVIAIHEILYRRFKKKFHATDFNNLLEIDIYAVGFSQKILVQLIHHSGSRTLKVKVEKPRKHNNRDNNC